MPLRHRQIQPLLITMIMAAIILAAIAAATGLPLGITATMGRAISIAAGVVVVLTVPALVVGMPAHPFVARVIAMTVVVAVAIPANRNSDWRNGYRRWFSHHRGWDNACGEADGGGHQQYRSGKSFHANP